MNPFVFKQFYNVALVLTGIVLIAVMLELIGLLTGVLEADLFAHSYVELLVLNSIGIGLLIVWIGVYVYQLLKERKRRIPGTQLALRILRSIAAVTFLAITVIYLFAFLSINRGIDDWFELQLGDAVEEANQLRTMIFDSLESQVRADFETVVRDLATVLEEQGSALRSMSNGDEKSQNTAGSIASGFAVNLDATTQRGVVLGTTSRVPQSASHNDSSKSLRSEIFRIIFDATQANDYEEVTYFEDLASPEGIVVSSASRIDTFLPVQPSERLIEQLLQETSPQQIDALGDAPSPSQTSSHESLLIGRQSSWELLADERGAASLRMLMPIPVSRQAGRHYLQVLTQLPLSSQRLAERVSLMQERNERLEFMRGPLKVSVVLALTFFTLVAALLATWVAVSLTRKLVIPIRTLSEGTVAVAQGRYEKLAPVAARDDLGVLVESFNDMVRRIKESQEQIRHSHLLAEQHSAYLEVVLEHLSSGVLYIDHEQRLTNINLATESILEISADSIVGKQCRDIVSQNRRLSALFISISNVIENQIPEFSETVELESDGGKRVLSYSITELPELESRSTDHVVVVEDITALVQAQRGVAWREVARRMAHEMLNPLQPIKLAVDRVEMKTQKHFSKEESQSLELSFAAINRQLNAMQRIVSEFKDYAKPVELRFEPVDLNGLIREVVAVHRQQGKQDEFVLNLADSLPLLKGDADKLVQVFNNLIVNAREAIEDGVMSMKIETKIQDGKKILVSVIDNGPGFDSDVIDRLFEPYSTTKKQGMGFGLDIARRIVEAHNGSVSATNNPQGAGAQILLKFNISETIIQKSDMDAKMNETEVEVHL